MSGVLLRGDGSTTVLSYQGGGDQSAIQIGTTMIYNDTICDDGNGSQEYCSARKYAKIIGGLDKDSASITVDDASKSPISAG